MDKQQAQDIVRDTFESPFDKGRFVGFVKNLLNSIQDAPFSYKGNFIPDAYEQYIGSLERIGKYAAGDHKIDILIVKLKKKTSIERARTMQRNFIAWYLNGSRGGEMKDAALAAFVSPDGEDWRFSLVKMDYRFEEGKSGKVKIKEEFTPARRWSFLVGRNENSHTAQSSLVTILADDKNNPTLAVLEEAFNIEKVTKEFFEKYRDLFLRTKETLDDVVAKDANIKADFEAKGVNTVDFAKKLLGQIVFLYFLQKKGWFGVVKNRNWGEGDKQFLRSLFEKAKKENKNYFNNFLEPLFYEALRNDRSHEDHYFSMLDCKIPFLNGGLFDPMNGYDWKGTDIELPNALFSNEFQTKEGDKGSGILDIFDRYNFTVKEDEPLEKEVAVDPEMLGKVFENLLEVKDRKSKGTYYTPREIVHYMCQQSLINYLYTVLNEVPVSYEKLGKDQTIMFKDIGNKPQMDLTIEHRPTPIISKESIDTLIKYGEQVGENEARVEAKGRETRDYYYKLSESIRQHAKLVDDKLADIKVCDPAIGSGAFPVGMMSEIVKTRNVLSAFIKDPDRTIYNFKRECIEKSLYGVDIDSGAVEIAKLRLWLSLMVDEEDIKQIKPLPNLDYKIVCGNSLLGVEKNLFNDVLFKELERIKPLLFNETSPKKKQEYKNQIDDLISKITNGHKEFDFEVHFSEVFHEKKGFDVVIGNPPYVSAWSMTKENPALRLCIKKELDRYPFLVGHWDLYIAFVAKGHQILRLTGAIAYIVPNPILREKYASEVRKYLLRNMTLTSILAFNDVNVFENVSRRTTVFVALKKETLGNYKIPIFGNEDDTIRIINEIDRDDWLGNPRHVFLIRGDSSENEVIKKIEEKSERIGDYFYVNYGAQVSSKKKGAFGKNAVVGAKPVGNAKQFYEGKDVQRWRLAYRGLWLDYKEDEIYGPRAPELFEQPKIVVRKVSNRDHLLAATLDTSKRYTDDGNVILVPYKSLADTRLRSDFEGYRIAHGHLDLRYALAILLSSLENFYFRRRFATESLQGSTSHTYPASVRAMPICKLSDLKQQPFIALVDQILTAKNKNPNTDTSALEKQIDEMVYALYGLTAEEIAIVEGK